MKHGSSEHHAKHQRRVVSSEEYEVGASTFDQMPHKLPCVPAPFADFYLNSYSSELHRPKAHKKVVVDYNESANYKVSEEKQDEDVNSEADEFIKHEHKRFQLSKTLSVNGN